MKSFYVFCLLLFFSSCQNKERELLLKTQDEYIAELEEKKELINEALKSNYSNGRLKIDSIELLEKFNLSFNILYNNQNSITSKNHETNKENLFNGNKFYKEEYEKFKNSIKLPSSKNSSIINQFKIELLQNTNKILEFMLNSTTSISCFGPPEYRVIYGNDIFYENKELFKKGYFFLNSNNEFNHQIEEIFIGKLDSSLIKEEIGIINSLYYSQNEDDIKINNIIESHKIQKNGVINIEQFSDNCFRNKLIEGIARARINKTLFVFVPFRIEFDE